MYFTTAAIASSFAALAIASPCTAPAESNPNAAPAGVSFRLYAAANSTNSQFSNDPVQAKSRSLVLGAEEQGAGCGPEPHEFAEFELSKEGDLFLHTDFPPQQLYVVRSGMARGIVQYSTGVEPLPKGADRKIFAVTDVGKLVYRDPVTSKEIGFQACGPIEGAKWKIWLDEFTNPADAKECTPITIRAEKVPEPVKCMYTSE